MTVRLLESRSYALNGAKGWRVSLWEYEVSGRTLYRVRLINEAKGWHMQTPGTRHQEEAAKRYLQLCRLCQETLQGRL